MCPALAFHAQAALRHARQEAASAIGQGQAPAISTPWWKFLKAGSLDRPMMLKLVGAPNLFRYVAAGGRMRVDAPL
jgi:hypothetical protein